MKRTITTIKPLTIDEKNLELKNLVFTLWTKILYNQGTITFEECNKALSEIKKMTK